MVRLRRGEQLGRTCRLRPRLPLQGRSILASTSLRSDQLRTIFVTIAGFLKACLHCYMQVQCHCQEVWLVLDSLSNE